MILSAMDLVKQLLKEHSKKNCKRIVEYIGFDKKKFEELINIYLMGPYRLTQRAAWPMSYCVEAHPELIKPHLNKVLTFALKPDANVAVKRNTVRLLQYVPIPRKFHAKVLKMCFQFLENKSETIAVQVFAMAVLANLAKEIPEIGNELKVIIEDRLPYASAGFRSRAAKILKEL